MSQCKRGACDVAIRLPRKRVDDLKAVQATSGCNTEDSVHYHWLAIPVMIASIPFDTVIPAAVKLLF